MQNEVSLMQKVYFKGKRCSLEDFGKPEIIESYRSAKVMNFENNTKEEIFNAFEIFIKKKRRDFVKTDEEKELENKIKNLLKLYKSHKYYGRKWFGLSDFIGNGILLNTNLDYSE